VQDCGQETAWGRGAIIEEEHIISAPALGRIFSGAAGLTSLGRGPFGTGVSIPPVGCRVAGRRRARRSGGLPAIRTISGKGWDREHATGEMLLRDGRAQLGGPADARRATPDGLPPRWVPPGRRRPPSELGRWTVSAAGRIGHIGGKAWLRALRDRGAAAFRIRNQVGSQSRGGAQRLTSQQVGPGGRSGINKIRRLYNRRGATAEKLAAAARARAARSGGKT